METLIKQLDKSGSGLIDFDDFVDGFGPWLLGDMSLLNSTTPLVDTSDPIEEEPLVLSLPSSPEKTTEEINLKEIYSNIDASGKGITISDFLKLIKVSCSRKT